MTTLLPERQEDRRATNKSVRTVRGEHAPGRHGKPWRLQIRMLTKPLRQQEAGNVHGREAAEATGEYRAARTQSRTSLRVEPVVARYRLRRHR